MPKLFLFAAGLHLVLAAAASTQTNLPDASQPKPQTTVAGQPANVAIVRLPSRPTKPTPGVVDSGARNSGSQVPPGTMPIVPPTSPVK